jgi:hypothetical protein
MERHLLKSDLLEAFNLIRYNTTEISNLYRLSSLIDFNISRKLLTSVELLKAKIPNLSEDLNEDVASARFEEWWQVNNVAWTNELRSLLRNIGHDWQFSDRQKEKLRQYHDANQLLVECLNSASPAVREEIEEGLMLPIENLRQ